MTCFGLYFRADVELVLEQGVSKKVRKVTTSLTLIIRVYDNNGAWFLRDTYEVLFVIVGSLYVRLLL